MNVKQILGGWATLIIISGCFCGEPRTTNIFEDPTDGGPLDGSCDGSSDTLPACVRDGDYTFYTCREGNEEPVWLGCGEGELCWGQRDDSPAYCATEDYVLEDTDEGIEPGSDWWLDEKARREAEEQGGGSSSCCKVCTSSKACGDSCISRSSTCNVGRGCACNG